MHIKRFQRMGEKKKGGKYIFKETASKLQKHKVPEGLLTSILDG